MANGGLEGAAPPRVALVGAGSCGIAVLKAMLDAGVAVECFERADTIGGNWVYGGAGSACYATLHANTSRDRMQYADFPMPADMPAFPRHDRVREYFDSYVENFGLREHIRLGCGVAHAQRTPDGAWDVTLDDGDERAFDMLVLAHGHYSRPVVPDFPGSFDGITLHSHDYRDPSLFSARRVVVVGMGNSAMDIACDASTRAERVHLVARRGVHVVPKLLFGVPYDMLPNHAWIPLPLRRAIFAALVRLATGGPARHGLPRPDHRILSVHPTISADLLDRVEHGDISVKPAIRELAGDRVRFVDGSEVEADVLVACTGYEPAFPFLGAGVLDNPRDPALFKRMFPPRAPTLAFVGLLQPLGPVMPIAELQGKLVADYLTGRYALPPVVEMERSIARDRRRHARRFRPDERHALEIDAEDYKRELRRERRRGARRADRGGHRLPVTAGRLRGRVTTGGGA
jgi:dimethylaniline monooxygenase (N-oxide forming)